jgi:hypothetical protein
MIKIAHRGNVDGAKPESENHPFQLVATISAGFEVETDIWVEEGLFFLGHDSPLYPIDESYIKDISKYAWFHCKNLQALEKFSLEFPDLRYFWHENDRFTLTSNGYIWTYPNEPVTSKSIIVDLESVDFSKYGDVPYAICTDYPSVI